MIVQRRTVSSPVVFEGKGLHSGEPVRVTVHPGESGIWFRAGSQRVEAVPENVTDTSRCTRLGPVSTIEHLMSAFAGLEITDAEVEVDGGEIPGLDGSAAGFLSLQTVEIGEREMPPLFSRIFHQEDHGLKLAVGKGTGHWRFTYNIGARWPGEQSFELPSLPDDYVTEVAPARTLVLSEEIPAVQAMGLGKGLDESSVLIVGAEGYMNEPRFPDEIARHKLLDLIGDLYLAGVPVRYLNVVGERSGHRANVHVAHMLRQALSV